MINLSWVPYLLESKRLVIFQKQPKRKTSQSLPHHLHRTALPNGLGCEGWAVALTHSDLEGHVLGEEEGNLPLQPAT